mgnify:CR=1 FL=1
MRALVLLCVVAACGDGLKNEPITFGTMGPLVGDAGRGPVEQVRAMMEAVPLP